MAVHPVQLTSPEHPELLGPAEQPKSSEEAGEKSSESPELKLQELLLPEEMAVSSVSITCTACAFACVPILPSQSTVAP